MSNILQVEELIKTLTGGSQPEVGTTIQLTEKGWRFREIYTKEEMDVKLAEIDARLDALESP